MRFFEGQNLNQTGVALGISEDAARMQISRALTKIRKLLAKSVVVVSVAALADLIAQPLANAIPAG